MNHISSKHRDGKKEYFFFSKSNPGIKLARQGDVFPLKVLPEKKIYSLIKSRKNIFTNNKVLTRDSFLLFLSTNTARNIFHT